LKGNLLPEEGRRREKVRIQKENDRARGTHFLETTEEGTIQDMARKLLSKEHLLPRDHRGGTSQDTETKQLNKGHSLPGDRRR